MSNENTPETRHAPSGAPNGAPNGASSGTPPGTSPKKKQKHKHKHRGGPPSQDVVAPPDVTTESAAPIATDASQESTETSQVQPSQPEESAPQEPPDVPPEVQEPTEPPQETVVEDLRLRMKVWTDHQTGKRYLMPTAFMRDVVDGQPITDKMYAYAMRDDDTKLVTLTAREWNALPFFYFREDGPAPRATARPVDVVR